MNSPQQVFTALIHREDEWFVADCPEVGTVGQGQSEEEALEDLKRATAIYLLDFPVPPAARSSVKQFQVHA